MAGTIAADILTHSSAGSLTTDFIVNGSAKAWGDIDGTGTVHLDDSFNISSVTDGGTGIYTPQINNNMNNAHYAAMAMSSSITADSNRPAVPIVVAKNTGAFAIRVVGTFNNNTDIDIDPTTFTTHGDLA